MNNSETLHRPGALGVLLAIGVSLLPAIAWAHPGHGSGGLWPGFVHPFSGVDHLLAALAVGVWAARSGGRAMWAVPLAFLSAMAAGSALVLAGVTLPLAEPAIAASVALLGLLIVFDARLGVPIGLVLVAVLAPFHGAAHAVELPGTYGVIAYAAGLLLATGLLHAAGVGVALALRARPLVLRALAAPVALAGFALLATRVG